MTGEELRTRTGSLRVEHEGERFTVTAAGHVGPRLVRWDLERAAAFGVEHPRGWWYVVDTSGVRLPNPLNLAYLRRIRRLPNLRGYVVVAPAAPLRLVARGLGAVSRPDAVVRSRAAADRFIASRGEREALPLFLFDGDCGFCRRWSAWLARRTGDRVSYRAYQSVADLADLGVSPELVQRASCLVDEEGAPHIGAAGFAEAFKRSGGLWPVAGYVLTIPGVRALAVAVYEAVARNRHRLPAPDA